MNVILTIKEGIWQVPPRPRLSPAGFDELLRCTFLFSSVLETG